MTRRTIIGIIFIVAALLRLADMWGILELNWEHSWTEYFGPILLLYIGAELIIHSYVKNPSQWLKRPIPQGEEGKRISCAVRFGADEYDYRAKSSMERDLMPFAVACALTCARLPSTRMRKSTSTPSWAAWKCLSPPTSMSL